MRELVGDDELVVTLPKVTSEAQVQALVAVLERLEKQVSTTSRGQRFEIQVETPQTVLGPDGSALVARMIRAGGQRLSGLHYGTYDYSAFLGLAAGDQSLEHPAADHAKAVMQAAAAGTGVELSDGSTNVLPVGDGLRLGWETHHRLVTRALHRGFYQGWDLHPAQLPTRFAATFQFFRAGAADADARLVAYAAHRTGAIADEPATVRALADYLLRGLDCGALTDDEVSLGRGDLVRLARRREGELSRWAIVLGANQYGKAENRVVRIYRDTDRHEIRDLNVSTSLRGDFAAAHVDGDQSQVLPTDTQKNTAFAYAKEHGVTSPEDYALALGRRLLVACPAADEALVGVQEYAWDRLDADHAFVRRGTETRTVAVVVGETTTVRSGLTDLTVLKSTGSEFKGFLVDEYTTLAETDDRILATSLTATWLHASRPPTDGRLGSVVRRRAGRAPRDVRDDLLPRAAGDAARHGPGGARGARRHRRDLVRRAEQAPLPGRPDALRAREPRRGVHRRGPALRVDRGDRHPRRGVSADAMPLNDFNTLPTDEARARVAACLDVPRWVQAWSPPAPTRTCPRSSPWLRGRARTSTTTSSRPRWPGTRGSVSARASAGTTPRTRRTSRPASTATTRRSHARLVEGNRAYEERFDRVFLVRAAGRDGDEILAELERRLGNDDATERAETVEQLTPDRVAAARAGAELMATLSTHVLDTSLGRPAVGVRVTLESDAGVTIGEGATDADGRLPASGPSSAPATTGCASTPPRTTRRPG